MAKTSTTTQGLRAAIERSGYYPALVAEAVEAAIGGEPIRSYLVHQETTFDSNEVRRHVTVLVLTGTRFIVSHTDEQAADTTSPTPYATTSTESVKLGRISSVVRQPGRRQPGVVRARHAAPRGRPDHRLGRRLPHRPGARRLRRPQLRGGPRLHRQLDRRRPEPARQRGRRRPGHGPPDPRLRPGALRGDRGRHPLMAQPTAWDDPEPLAARLRPRPALRHRLARRPAAHPRRRAWTYRACPRRSRSWRPPTGTACS